LNLDFPEKQWGSHFPSISSLFGGPQKLVGFPRWRLSFWAEKPAHREAMAIPTPGFGAEVPFGGGAWRALDKICREGDGFHTTKN